MSSSASYMKEWRRKNADHIRAYQLKYNAEHAEEIKNREITPERRKILCERAKAYYHKNKHVMDKAKKKAYHAEWAKNNREKLKEYRKKWFSERPGRNSIYQKKYFDANQEKIRAANTAWRKRVGKKYMQDWYAKNPGILTDYAHRRRARENSVTFDDSAKAFFKYVRTQEFVGCVYCGKIISGKEAHIDHLIALSRGGHHIGSNLRVSCKSCNLSKHDKLLEEWKPELVGLV